MAQQHTAAYVRAGYLVAVITVLILIGMWVSNDGPTRTFAPKPPTGGYRQIICENAASTEINYRTHNREQIDIPLTPGCFSGFVTVPDSWQSWQGQMMGDNASDWVAEWYAGWTQPRGPWSAGQINGGVVNFHDMNFSTTRKLRAEGQGMLRLVRITGDETPTEADRPNRGASPKQAAEAASPDDEPLPAPKAIIRTRIMPTSGMADGYVFFLEECHWSGDGVDCSGKVANTTDATEHFWASGNDAVDDEGNSINLKAAGQSSGAFNQDLLPNVPVKFTFGINEPHKKATKIALSIDTFWQHGRGTLVFDYIPIQ